MASDHETKTDAGHADFAVGAAALALGIAALLLIPSQVSSTAYQSLGDIRSPAFFPVLASGLLVLCAAALIFRSRHRKTGPSARLTHFDRRAAMVAGLLFAAGIVLIYLGFLATAFALIIGLSYAFGARRHGIVLLSAIAVPAAIHLLFRSVLDVLLPQGVFL